MIGAFESVTLAFSWNMDKQTTPMCIIESWKCLFGKHTRVLSIATLVSSHVG